MLCLLLLLFWGMVPVAYASGEKEYRLVKLVHLDKTSFDGNYEDSGAYADIEYPDCQAGGSAEIDIGERYLGGDCFYGEVQFIEIRKKKSAWRIHLPLCYSTHIYNLSRNARIYCAYPVTP